MQQSFASPDADDPDVFGFAPIHDAERRVDEFPEKRLVEFGHDSAYLGVDPQHFDLLEDFLDEPIPYIRHVLFDIPLHELFEICNR